MERTLIEWDILANQNDYSAIAMARLRFPEGTSRLIFKRTRYLLLSLIYRNELKKMYFLFREPQFKHLPALHPEILEKPITPYIFASSTASKRAAMVEEHYRLVSTLFPDLIKPIYLDNGITLGHYPANDMSIRVGHHNTFRREGEMDISIINERGDRLYSCAFSLTGTTRQMELIIGSVQGPEPSLENAQELIKSMTKEAFGLRPKSLVVQLVLALAKHIGVSRVLAVKKDAHVLQAKRFSKDHRAKLHADYDELWAEFDAKDEDDNFVELGPLKRKSLEEIASQKRSMYRRRYEWLDNLERNIYLTFKREAITPLSMT